MAGISELRDGFHLWKDTRAVPEILSNLRISAEDAAVREFADANVHHVLFLADVFLEQQQFQSAAMYYVRGLAHFNGATRDELAEDASEFLSEVANMQHKDIRTILRCPDATVAAEEIRNLLEEDYRKSQKALEHLNRLHAQQTAVHCTVEDAARYCLYKLLSATCGDAEVSYELVHAALFWAKAAFAYSKKEQLFSANPLRYPLGPHFIEVEAVRGVMMEDACKDAADTLTDSFITDILDTAVSYVLRFVDEPTAAGMEVCKEPICNVTPSGKVLTAIYDVYQSCDPNGSICRIFPALDKDCVAVARLPGVTIVDVSTPCFRWVSPPEASTYASSPSAEITGVQHCDGSYSINTLGGHKMIATTSVGRDPEYTKWCGSVQERWYLECGNGCANVRTSDSDVCPTNAMGSFDDSVLCLECKRPGEWKSITFSVALRLTSTVAMAPRKIRLVAPQELVLAPDSSYYATKIRSLEVKPFRVTVSALTGTRIYWPGAHDRDFPLRYTLNHLDTSEWQFCGCFLSATPDYYKHIMQPGDVAFTSPVPSIAGLDVLYSALMKLVQGERDDEIIYQLLLMCQWLEIVSTSMTAKTPALLAARVVQFASQAPLSVRCLLLPILNDSEMDKAFRGNLSTELRTLSIGGRSTGITEIDCKFLWRDGKKCSFEDCGFIHGTARGLYNDPRRSPHLKCSHCALQLYDPASHPSKVVTFACCMMHMHSTCFWRLRKKVHNGEHLRIPGSEACEYEFHGRFGLVFSFVAPKDCTGALNLLRRQVRSDLGLVTSLYAREKDPTYNQMMYMSLQKHIVEELRRRSYSVGDDAHRKAVCPWTLITMCDLREQKSELWRAACPGVRAADALPKSLACTSLCPMKHVWHGHRTKITHDGWNVKEIAASRSTHDLRSKADKFVEGTTLSHATNQFDVFSTDVATVTEVSESEPVSAATTTNPSPPAPPSLQDTMVRWQEQWNELGMRLSSENFYIIEALSA